MKELCIPADSNQLNEVLAFLEESLDEFGCSAKLSMKIQLAIEELFVNVANYAYPEETTGQVRMRIEEFENPHTVRIELIDNGIAFDPLANPEPDITLDAGARRIGGLGIYMVRQIMDEVHYQRRDGFNHITVEKILQP